MPASDAPAVPTQHRKGRYGGAEGVEIFWQAWLPEGEPKATVVIAHGVSEHSSRYRYVVETLVPLGFAVYGLDHRGHGRSGGKRAQVGRMAHLLADLDQLVDMARKSHPAVKLFLLGHSMGGCIAIAYALVHQEKLDGLALSAPLAALEAAPLPLRLIARGLSLVAPDAGILAIAADGVSRDPAEVADYEQDPLNHHGKLPARTVQELTSVVGTFEAAVGELTLPLLVMVGTADTLVPPQAAQMVHDRASSTDKTLHTYDGFYHEIFNEPAGDRDRPLSDLATWLSEHTA